MKETLCGSVIAEFVVLQRLTNDNVSSIGSLRAEFESFEGYEIETQVCLNAERFINLTNGIERQSLSVYTCGPGVIHLNDSRTLMGESDLISQIDSVTSVYFEFSSDEISYDMQSYNHQVDSGVDVGFIPMSSI